MVGAVIGFLGNSESFIQQVIDAPTFDDIVWPEIFGEIVANKCPPPLKGMFDSGFNMPGLDEALIGKLAMIGVETPEEVGKQIIEDIVKNLKGDGLSIVHRIVPAIINFIFHFKFLGSIGHLSNYALASINFDNFKIEDIIEAVRTPAGFEELATSVLTSFKDMHSEESIEANLAKIEAHTERLERMVSKAEEIDENGMPTALHYVQDVCL